MKTRQYRDQLVIVLIAFVSAVFGVVLVMSPTLLEDVTRPGVDSGADVLRLLSFVFIGISTYTAWIVTANSVATIVAGRVREIALYRLLGAEAWPMRKAIAIDGAVTGVIGSGLGLLVSLALYRGVVTLLVVAGSLPDVPYRWFTSAVLIPAVVTIVTIVAALLIGSRVVGTVPPIEALSANIEAPVERLHVSARRRRTVWLLEIVGVILLVSGMLLGGFTPGGIAVTFLGGVSSATGIVIGAIGIVPGLLQFVGRCLERLAGRRFADRVTVRLARENAVRTPRAATRTTISMIVGVTLVTLFIVTGATVRGAMLADIDPEGLTQSEIDAAVAAVNRIADIGMLFVTIVTSVSGVLAAIGIVSNLSLNVIQRSQEIGVLRVIGATGRQVREMIGAEALLTSIVGIWAGLGLGIVYGWAAAQSSIGSGIAVLIVPWQLVVVVVLATVALTLGAAVGPATRATSESPIVALQPR